MRKSLVEVYLHIVWTTWDRIPCITLDLVRDVKGASSHYVTAKMKTESFFRWQGGYGAFSVDPRSVSRVAEYINNQKAHHAKNTAPAYLEQYLTDE